MKAILNMNYTDYVLELEDAIRILEIMDKAEVYEHRYIHSTHTNHYIFEQEAKSITVQLLPHALYTMAKMAGKPEKK